MYVDSLDLSTADFTGIGGPPPTHKFAVSAWTISAVKAVLAQTGQLMAHMENYRLVFVYVFFTRHAYKFDMTQPSVVYKACLHFLFLFFHS